MSEYNEKLVKELTIQMAQNTNDRRFIVDMIHFFDSDEEMESMLRLLKEKGKCSQLDMEKMCIEVADKRIMEQIRVSYENCVDWEEGE